MTVRKDTFWELSEKSTRYRDLGQFKNSERWLELTIIIKMIAINANMMAFLSARYFGELLFVNT